MHDRRVIRAERESGMSVRGTARRVGASRNAVRRALVPGARERYYRPSLTEAAEPSVRDVLADYPHMAVEDIALLIDWRHSRRTLSTLVARLRPEYTPREDVSARDLDSIETGTLGLGEAVPGELVVGEVVVL